MRPLFKPYWPFLAAAMLLGSFNSLSHAELEEEIQQVIYIDASFDDADDSIYPENWSDRKKVRSKNYDPHQDTSQHYLSNLRRFVINGSQAVDYYPLSEGKNPALFYSQRNNEADFALAQSYGAARQAIHIEPQLQHKLKDHQLFSIQPSGRNLMLIFRSRYFHTPAELKRNSAFSKSFASDYYRTSYELIEVTPKGKILHRAQFAAPSPENGFGFGPKLDESTGEYKDNVIEYTTSTPGAYQTLKPYDIEYRYEYQNGKLKKHTENRLLTLSERAALRENKGSINAENMQDEYNASQKDSPPESSSCLDDYWIFHDKAAPKGIRWGNDWMQKQPALHQAFLSAYESGKSYAWADFRQRFCDLK